MVGAEDKVVEFWSARAGEGRFTPGDETDELRWLSPPEAAALLTYESDRDVVDAFTARPPALRTLLLVRHALAGQALGLGRPGRRPPAGRGGVRAGAAPGPVPLPVRGDRAARGAQGPLPADAGAVRGGGGRDRSTRPRSWATARSRATTGPRSRLLEQLAAGGTGGALAAVCAQGDGIPHLVRALATAATRAGCAPLSDRDLADPPSRKGSVWVLSFGPTAPSPRPTTTATRPSEDPSHRTNRPRRDSPGTDRGAFRGAADLG